MEQEKVQDTTQNQPQEINDKYSNFFSLKCVYPTKYAKLSNGETLGYRECGEGTNVLLLHGNFTCSQVMEPIMKKLANHLKCVAPCMRGFGYSSYNKDMSSFKDLAADLKLFINEHMKFEKFYIIGHQLGGCVGLELAHIMQDQCLGVLNFSMFPLRGLKVPGFKIETLEDLQVLPEYRGFYKMMKNQDLNYYKDGFSQLINVQGIVDDYARRQLAIMNRQRNFWQACLGVHTFDFSDRINDLKMPLKLIYGMKDKVCPMESGLEYKEVREDPNSISVTGFPNARHFLIEEQEKNSIDHILEFLGDGKVMMPQASA